MGRRISVFKKTHDNWHGSYHLNEYYKGIKSQKIVEVIFCGQISDNLWRVCVWGCDDYSLERDFDIEDKAWQCFITIIRYEFVDIDILRNSYNFI